MTTNNHPAHGPVSLDRLHQIREILSKAAAQSDGGNLGYAVADAVKVIDGAIAAFGAEPQRNPVLAYADSYRDMAERGVESIPVWSVITDLERNIAPLYTAQPAPVSVHDESAIFEAAIDICRKSDAIDEHAWNHGVLAFMSAFRACRAAMLQAGNHTEQHLDMVDHSGDDNEKADCKLPFDQWLSQQNEPIDVDCGCVTTEAFYHWLRVAYEAGNSPVTPDGWIPVSERVPESDGGYLVWNGKHCLLAGFFFGGFQCNQFIREEITHWMPLPAVPQQQVKSALEHGMQRYAGAMQKLSEGDK